MELMGNQFRYYLTYDNTEYESEFAPEGWDKETNGGYRRDLKYFGLIRSLTLPLKFVNDGAEILNSALRYGGGIEAGVKLRVDERNDDWTYTSIFNEDIDFSKFTWDGIRFEVNILNSGISANIKARENTKYEFPLTGSDIVNIVIPGVKFSEKSTWIAKYVNPSDLAAGKRYVLGMDLVTNGFGSGYLTALNTDFRNAADSDDFTNDAFVVCNRAGGVSTNIAISLKGYTLQSPLEGDITFTIELRSNKFPFIKTLFSRYLSAIGLITFDISLDFDYNMQEDERLWIYVRGSDTPTASRLVITEGEINISYASVSDPSNCNGIRMFDLYKRLIKRIDPSAVPNSQYMLSKRANLILTSGSAIREIADAKMKLSLNEFFQMCYAMDDVGLGSYNGQLRIEEATAFARPVLIMDVGNVNSYQLKLSEEFAYNEIKVGYQDKTTDDENGREEYNAGQNDTLPITRVQKEINWISTFQASQYLIEKYRREYNVSKTATSDRDSDNDNFLIDCNPIDVDGNFKPILGSQLDMVTGLSFPNDAYNLLISPRHNLLNHSGFLRSVLSGMDGKFIEFGSADKNANIVVTANGITVDEDAPIPVSNLQGKYFQPYEFTITAKLPKNALRIIDANPFGYITFNYNGIIASGYVLEVSVDLAGNSARELRLLATDFSALP